MTKLSPGGSISGEKQKTGEGSLFQIHHKSAAVVGEERKFPEGKILGQADQKSSGWDDALDLDGGKEGKKRGRGGEGGRRRAQRSYGGVLEVERITSIIRGGSRMG